MGLINKWLFLTSFLILSFVRSIRETGLSRHCRGLALPKVWVSDRHTNRFDSVKKTLFLLIQSCKARLRVQEEELRKLQWEHEVLHQRFEQTQKERDELYTKFVKAIHEVQQKGNFKNLLLEKKLTSLGDDLEKKV